MAYSASAAKSWGANEALKEFGDTPKGRYAANVFGVGADLLATLPVGFNLGDDFSDILHSRIRYEITEGKNHVKPAGFLPAIGITWFFWQLIEGAISWAVRRLLDYYVLNKDS